MPFSHSQEPAGGGGWQADGGRLLIVTPMADPPVRWPGATPSVALLSRCARPPRSKKQSRQAEEEEEEARAPARQGLRRLRPSRLSRVVPASESGRVGPTCWFGFGNKDAEGAGIYGSQARDDFDHDDVEQYFNYMGMLAVEGTYDKMEALLNQDIHPVDILLMLAASEGDRPKIEELLRAGAK